MQEQLGLGGKVVVDDVVQQGDVDTARRHVRHDQHHGLPVDKLADVDLPGGLVQSTVDVRTLHPLQGEELHMNTG